MWGLKRVLHEFIPQEKGNLTEDYYLPMSKGLQNVLQSDGVNVSLGQVTILPLLPYSVYYSAPYTNIVITYNCATIYPYNRVTSINILRAQLTPEPPNF